MIKDAKPAEPEARGDKLPRLAYRPDDAAKAVGVGRTTIFEEIRAGRLRAKKVGRATIIAESDLRAWLDALLDRATPLLIKSATRRG